MSTWIALALVALGSYLFRFAPIVALERVTIPPRVDRALRYAGPAAMAALAVSAVLHDERITTSLPGAVSAGVALVTAGLLALLHKSFLICVGVGLVGFVVVGSTLT